MRITIDTDDKGRVNIDTGEQGGSVEGATDILLVDAGPAPIQDIERQRKLTTPSDVGSVSASASPQDREAQLPLNPLRAGAAASYANPGNLRKKAAGAEGTSTAAAQDASTVTIDGGSAKIPKDKKKSDAAPDQPSEKAAKRDRTR